jgi:hypothetical protein
VWNTVLPQDLVQFLVHVRVAGGARNVFNHVSPIYNVDVRILTATHGKVPDHAVAVPQTREHQRSARAKVVISGGQIKLVKRGKVVRDPKTGRQLQESVFVVTVLWKPTDNVGIKRPVAGRGDDGGWIIGGRS